ncbi:MAG: erythromycin biosynthesis sensory transduction protein eryC1, partial [Chloroflexi bacterium]|nr:erythromycin biosynthesis sensory transduction protein eryC1 [Chloroflexota bacterium]
DGGWPPAYQNYVAEGFNVPLDGLQAALLLVKLTRLKSWTARRREIAATLEAGLRDTPVTTPRFRPESAPTFRSYAIRSDRQLELHEGLRQAGIEAVIHYAPPVYRYQVYADAFPNREQLPVTEMLSRQVVNLPVTPELTDDEVNYMIGTVQQLLGVE